MIVVVEVPVVWEVPPRWGLVTVPAHAAFLVGFVSPGLVLQDLWDEAMVGLGGDEDGGHLEGLRRSWVASCLLALVLLDASRLCSGQGGLGWLGWWVGVAVVAPRGVRWW